MAKKCSSVKITKSIINLEDMTITEILKDTTNEYNIMDILKEWDGIENVSFTLSTDEEIKPIEGNE